MRRAYLTDLSDAEWECLKGYLPTPQNEGRPRLHSLREILDAIFYVVRSGCAWRLLPHDFPPWKTVYHYFFRFWRLDGTWESGVNPIFRTVPIVNFRPSRHVAPRILPAVGTRGWNAVVSGCRPPLYELAYVSLGFLEVLVVLQIDLLHL